MTRISRPSGALPVADPSRRQLPRIVAIGGGTGLPVVLRGLSEAFYTGANSLEQDSGAPTDHLTAIVTVTDDGGSSGRLRRELGILPPGDARNCLAALVDTRSPLMSLLQHRFVTANELNGHSIGNLILAALTQITGDFEVAVGELSRVLDARGRVLPSTHEDVSLVAEFESGELVDGETAIVARGGPIKRLSLKRDVRPLPEALRALINADAIVVGPGSLYTSILPNLLVGGVAATISGVSAARIYVANLMTEPGETDGFSLEDHLDVIRQHVGTDLFDYVLVNNRPVDATVVAQYAAQGASPVKYDEKAHPLIGHAQVVARSLSLNFDGSKIRHSPDDLAGAILDLLKRGRPGVLRQIELARPALITPSDIPENAGFPSGTIDLTGGRA
jgi:uncharacterized cofD-like protein